MSQPDGDDFPVRLKGESMWPTYPEGTVLTFRPVHGNSVGPGDVVLAQHPLKPDVLIVKRILRVEQNNDLFLTGDQPDPLASEDSHNFGPISRDAVIARCKEEEKRA